MKAKAVSILAAAAFVSLTAYSTSQSRAESGLDQLVAAAKKETDLNFMASSHTWGGQEGMAKLEAAFNDRYGTRLKIHFAAGPTMAAMAARTQEEYRQGVKASSDLFIGTSFMYVYLIKEGVLEKVDWRQLFPWITPEVDPFDGYGVLVRTSVEGIVYNPDLLDPADAPKSYEDLIDPVKSKAWAGRMAMPPYADWIVELSMIWPHDKVAEFAHKLTHDATGFIRYDQEERLVNGEFALMANDADGPGSSAFWASKGAKLNFVPGSNPALVYYNLVSVPKNATNRDLAILFASFVVSPEGQAIIDQNSFQGNHLLPTNVVTKYLATHKIEIMTPQQQFAFYTKGGDPALTKEIESLLQH